MRFPAVCLCALVFGLPLFAQGQLPRLDDSFTNNDRLYFGIGPRLAKTDSCVVREADLSIICYASDGEADTLQFSKETWSLLERYLQDYEQYTTFRRDLYQQDPKYASLVSIVRPGFNLSPTHHVAAVSTGAVTVTGVILARSDQSIILGGSSDLFESLDGVSMREFSVIEYDRITSVTLMEHGAAKGWVPTGSREITEGVLEYISPDDAFSTVYPPELRRADTNILVNREVDVISVVDVIGRSRGLRVDVESGFGVTPVYPSIRTEVNGWILDGPDMPDRFSWETLTASTSFFVTSIDVAASASESIDVGAGAMVQLPISDSRPLPIANVSQLGWMSYSVYATGSWYFTFNDVYGYQPLETHFKAKLGTSFTTYRHQTFVGSTEGRATVPVEIDIDAVQLFASADYTIGYWLTRNWGVSLHLGILANIGGSAESDPQTADDAGVEFTYEVTTPSLSNVMIQGGASVSYRF